jgi:uncharacterized protein YjeT (DUF2065 family)
VEQVFMRQLVLLATWTLVGTLLVASGVYLVIPGRNVHGNPWREREIASCLLSDSAEVTLYQGDAGASSPNWYSVTHNPKGLEPERQILYRYRSPGLYDVVCDSAGFIIQTDGRPIAISKAQARQLRQRPSGAQPLQLLRWLVGGALILAGGVLLWFLRPRRDD